VCLAVALILTTAAAACADEQADLKALIDKAIKAGGGEANLAKFKSNVFKGKGTFYGIGNGIEFTGEWAMQLPEKMRVQIETGGDMKFTFIQVVNGDKFWKKLADMTQEVTDKDEIAEMKEANYAGWVVTLLPLKDKGFQLAPLGEVKVNDRQAIGVRVSHKGHRDVSLYFDKDNGLLVKSETVVKDMMSGQEVTQESLYSDYKEVSGTKRPMKILINRDGKKYIESEVTEIEPKEKLDDAVFGKP